MALSLRAWRESANVVAFLASAVPQPGGLLRFEETTPQDLQDLLDEGPAELLDQAPGEGPRLATLIDRAVALGATLGGYASTLDRDDTVFFCDTITLPEGVSAASLDDLEPDDVMVHSDGRTRIWWD